MQKIVAGGIALSAVGLILFSWSRPLGNNHLLPWISILIFTEAAAHWVPRIMPFSKEVVDAIKIGPRVIGVLLLKEMAVGTLEYVPEPLSIERFGVFVALVLAGTLVGILANIFARQFREDNATRLRLCYEGIVHGTDPINLWPNSIVILGILLMGIGFCVAAPSDAFAKDGLVTLALLTLVWSGFLPLIMRSLLVIGSAWRHRQPPSPRAFIDALALQDSVNESKPQIRPQ